MATHQIKHNITAVVDPGVSDDDTLGYEKCSSWINTATVKLFMCADPATGAAVWKETTLPDHAATHVGADAIQSATAAQDGLATATQITKLDAIEALADVTDGTNVAAAGAVMDSDISAAEGFLRKTGAGVYEAIKSNLTATVDPTINEDSGDGYAVGSRWANVTLDKEFVCLDATVAAAVWKETTAGAASSQHTMFTPSPTAVATLGDYVVDAVGTSGAFNMSFLIPDDFASLVSVELICSPASGAAQTGRDIDFTSDYAGIGESVTQHSEADITSTYDFSGKADQWVALDISGVFSAIAAGDICGLLIDHNTVGGIISYAGVRLVYNK